MNIKGDLNIGIAATPGGAVIISLGGKDAAVYLPEGVYNYI